MHFYELTTALLMFVELRVPNGDRITHSIREPLRREGGVFGGA